MIWTSLVFSLLVGGVYADEPACEGKCTVAGHGCVGSNSACQKPSCAMGCLAGAHTTSEAKCNATCVVAGGAKPGSSGCTYKLPNSNITFQMCGTCPAMPAPSWWPQSIRPPAGQMPGWWPPGYALDDYSSCDSIDGDPLGECKLGCMFSFEPSLKPTPPPEPVPPAPRPPPQMSGDDISFSGAVSSHMVLQREPSQAAVYGFVGKKGSYASAKVEVTLAEAGSGPQKLEATVSAQDGSWKALLPAQPAGGVWTITASCTAGCTGHVSITDVTYGDVWYCGGQSNMALPMQYSYSRNASLEAIKAGKLSGMRITGLKGNMNADLNWTRIEDAAGGDNKTTPGYGEVPLDKFSSTCYYFGEALIAGSVNVPIGLIHTAWGGSMIEEWLTNEEVAKCKGASITDHNEDLYDSAIKPYLDTSVKGWVYYQGENNCGGLHGNSGTSNQAASGYACMMAKLVALWRKEWSRVPNTTDPMAPFGIVSLSAHDSEGAKDMASFRWAQQASYGTVPNAIMPNTFMSHAFDLQDPWNGNSGACISQPAGYDCSTPFFMGPGIHPRLKKPVGQRLALGALQAAYGKGSGTQGGVIKGCALSSNSLSLSFDMNGRKLVMREYSKSNPKFSATAVLVNGSTAWLPVHISLGGSPGTVSVDLSSLPAGSKPIAVRYAWGSTDSQGTPNGDDVSCCEGDGVAKPCVPGQCPLMAAEPMAPFGGLPADPFLAKIVDGKCECPEPQQCSSGMGELDERVFV